MTSGMGQGVARLASLIRIIGRAPHGQRLSDVANESGLSKSTVHRLLGSLVRERLIEHDEFTGRFYLSFEFFALGATAANRYGLVDLALPNLTRIEEECHDTVYFSVPWKTEAICLHRIEGRFPIKVLTLQVGSRRPLGVGSGSLALLAFMPDDEISSVLESNAKELEEYPGFAYTDILDMIKKARRAGHTLNQGMIIKDMSAIGVPVMGPDGFPLAAISVAAIGGRMEPKRRKELFDLISHEAKALEAEIAEMTSSMSMTSLQQLSAVDPNRPDLRYYRN